MRDRGDRIERADRDGAGRTAARRRPRAGPGAAARRRRSGRRQPPLGPDRGHDRRRRLRGPRRGRPPRRRRDRRQEVDRRAQAVIAREPDRPDPPARRDARRPDASRRRSSCPAPRSAGTATAAPRCSPKRAAPPEPRDFLAEVSREWEAATEPAERAGIRTVHLRTGIVLAGDGRRAHATRAAVQARRRRQDRLGQAVHELGRTSTTRSARSSTRSRTPSCRGRSTSPRRPRSRTRR